MVRKFEYHVEVNDRPVKTPQGFRKLFFKKKNADEFAKIQRNKGKRVSIFKRRNK